MHDHAMTGCVLWSQVILVLAVAAAVIVAGAAAAAGALRSAAWKRTIWQAAAAALCGLVLVELLGAGEALIRLSRAASTSSGRPTTTPLSRVGRGAGGEGEQRGRHEAIVGQPLRPSGPIAAAPTAPTTPPPPAESPPLLPEPPEPSFPLAGIESPSPPAVVEWTPLGGPFADETTSLAAARLSRKRPPVATIPPAAVPPPAPGPAGPARWPGFVWGIGAAAVLGRAAWTQLLLCRFRRRHGRAPGESLWRRVDALARRLGIRRPVCLLEASGLRVPVAFGLVRPTLVLPASFAGDYSDREQEAILAHELAHLAARDPLWQLVADVLAAALWWHPLVWWLRARLRAASEAAADEASLLVPGGPDVLAACLVALGRKLVHPRRLGWLSIEGPRFRSGLGRRVERLLSLQAGVWRSPARARLTIARIALPLALVTVSVFSTAWARPQATLQEGETAMSLVKSSWQRSLAAIALAAWLGPASPTPAADEKPPLKEFPPPVQAAPAHTADAPADAKADNRLRGEVRIAVEAKQPAANVAELPESGAGAMRHVSLRALELLQRRGKLEAETRDIERKLGELRDDQDKEAKELFERLRKVQREVRKVDEEIEKLPPHLRPMFATPVIAAPPGQPIHFSTPGIARSTARGAAAVEPTLAPPRVQQRRSVVMDADGRQREVIEEVPGPYPAAPRGPALAPEDRERRMKRVHEAAAKLREAGLPEQADRLIHEAEAIFSGHSPMLQQPMMMPRPSMPGMAPPQAMQPGGPSGMMSAPGPGMRSPLQPTPPAPGGGFGMMSPPGYPGTPPGDAAGGEIREQLRQLQKQIEELRREVQEVKQGRPPRPVDRAKRPAASDEENPFDERPKREARPAPTGNPFGEPELPKADPPRR